MLELGAGTGVVGLTMARLGAAPRIHSVCVCGWVVGCTWGCVKYTVDGRNPAPEGRENVSRERRDWIGLADPLTCSLGLDGRAPVDFLFLAGLPLKFDRMA